MSTGNLWIGAYLELGSRPSRTFRWDHCGFRVGPTCSAGKESVCNAGDLGSIPGLGRSPGGGHGNPLQYSCLGNPMDRGAWGLQSIELQRVRHDWVTGHMHERNENKLQQIHKYAQDVLVTARTRLESSAFSRLETDRRGRGESFSTAERILKTG